VKCRNLDKEKISRPAAFITDCSRDRRMVLNYINAKKRQCITPVNDVFTVHIKNSKYKKW